MSIEPKTGPAEAGHYSAGPAKAEVHDGSVDVRNIVKRFGNFTAVDGISFAVKPGEIFGLLGPNGAGKSTLIRMMVTLLPPTSGTAIINGFDVRQQADQVRRSIGVIPQAMTTDLELSVEENLLIFAKLYGVSKEKRNRLIPELLAAVELSQWADKPVKNLSGGMRRRVEIARGLVHEPRVFFLDEPTTGLDPVSRTAVWEMLQKVKGERDLTVLLTTHYMDEADRLCDRLAIVDHGKLVALDTPRALKAAVPGASAIEAQIDRTPDGWESSLLALDGVASAHALGGDSWRLVADDAGRAATALVTLAQERGIALRSLTVSSTTLDDVFTHYAGHALLNAAPAAARTAR